MSSTSSRLHYISWERYGDHVTRLAEMVADSGRKFEIVIGIARGGMPVAMVVADRLGVKVDFINVKSYTGIWERQSTPAILSTITEEISGKSVLLVDDLVDGGNTMQTVTAFLSSRKPRSMMTAVLFVKPWSAFVPDFSLEEVKKWIVFPYERGEVQRSMLARKGERILQLDNLGQAQHSAADGMP